MKRGWPHGLDLHSASEWGKMMEQTLININICQQLSIRHRLKDQHDKLSKPLIITVLTSGRSRVHRGQLTIHTHFNICRKVGMKTAAVATENSVRTQKVWEGQKLCKPLFQHFLIFALYWIWVICSQKVKVCLYSVWGKQMSTGQVGFVLEMLFCFRNKYDNSHQSEWDGAELPLLRRSWAR